MRLPPLAPATALAAAFLVSPPLGAGTPRIAVTAGARDFLAGDTKGVAVSADGRLMLGAALAGRAWPDDGKDASGFGAAADSSGRVFVATGGGLGRLFVSTDAKVTLLFTAPEPNITAVAVAPDGLVVCASSPNGKIYRVDPKATDPAKSGAVLAEPKEAAIWALAFARDGTLYVGTGNKGRVYRKTPLGVLELFHEIEDVHVRTLAVGPDGTVYAGTSDRGLVVGLPVQGSPRCRLRGGIAARCLDGPAGAGRAGPSAHTHADAGALGARGGGSAGLRVGVRFDVSGAASRRAPFHEQLGDRRHSARRLRRARLALSRGVDSRS